jgi:flagellar motor switch protein FliM
VSDLLSLQVGDVITTEKQIDGEAFVDVEGNHKFRGILGQLRGKRALRITAVTSGTDEPAATNPGASR